MILSTKSQKEGFFKNFGIPAPQNPDTSLVELKVPRPSPLGSGEPGERHRPG